LKNVQDFWTTVIQQKLDEITSIIPPPTKETYLSAALKKMPLGTQKNILERERGEAGEGLRFVKV
tara:strand:+ start:230 stop:424 length:195 start_codon:yes stop_codon:yes gene_type:complete